MGDTVKLYIDGPDDNGDGIYHLLAETGEHLASHLCSHVGFARFDLHDRRADLRKTLAERFGEYQVLFLGDDDMTSANLERLNHEWATAAALAPAPSTAGKE